MSKAHRPRRAPGDLGARSADAPGRNGPAAPFACLVAAAALLAAPAFATTAGLAAQEGARDTAAARPAADPADVSSMDAILAALYDVISGPAGQKRDWDRMRSLFIPGARLVPTGVDSAGTTRWRTMSVDDYIRWSGPYLEKNGFFEKEIGRTVERYGTIAQVFSAYASRHEADDAEPFQRGINSVQLLWDGSRWWVVTIFWEPERPGHPIPERFGG
ncbi:MAG TPA: hypothetical protein VKB18_01505 [Gemmatimonadota bacterium]|nr:hypothetical protein [Gemmatimonadota bacterium]